MKSAGSRRSMCPVEEEVKPVLTCENDGDEEQPKDSYSNFFTLGMDIDAEAEPYFALNFKNRSIDNFKSDSDNSKSGKADDIEGDDDPQPTEQLEDYDAESKGNSYFVFIVPKLGSHILKVTHFIAFFRLSSTYQ